MATKQTNGIVDRYRADVTAFLLAAASNDDWSRHTVILTAGH